MKFTGKKVFRLILTILISTSMLFLFGAAFAESSIGRDIIVDGDIYLGGNYLEVGIDNNGWFGASSDAPLGFHPYTSQRANIGMIMDGDGFDVGMLPQNGDFFLPGGPVEGYGIGYRETSGGVPIRRVSTNPVLDGVLRQNMTLIDLSSGDMLSALHTVDDGKVKLEQKVSFDKDELFLKMEVTLTNISTQKLYDVRYFRKLDPDQEGDVYGEYSTHNKVEENPTLGNKALVYAKGPVTGTPFFYASFDSNARASIGESSDPFSKEMYDANGDALLTSQFYGDTQIALTFAEGDLDAGESVTLIFYQSLNPNMNASLAEIEEKAVIEPKLTGLRIENGILSPSFTSEMLFYNATLPVGTKTTKVTPIATSGSSILVNGVPVNSGMSSGEIAVNTGNNLIPIRVMRDSMTKEYVINALVASNDLSRLTLNTGVLSPAFTSNIKNYTVYYPAATSSTSITAVPVTSGARIKIGEIQVTSGSPIRVGLSNGVNIIPVKITAEDGAVKTYTITAIVAKLPSESAYLSSLTLASGTLSPNFDPNTLDYYVNYPALTTSMKVSVVPMTTGSMVKVNNTLTTGSAINVTLSTGQNIIPIEVVGLDNSARTYHITASVAEQPKALSELSSLTLDSGLLSPSFDPSTLNYYVDYPANTTSMGIRAVPVTSSAMVNVGYYYGSISGSAVNVPLNTGSNVIPIRVWGPDYTTRTYTITARVAEPPMGSSYLSSLTVDSGSMFPTFSPNTLNYNVYYPSTTTSMGIKAIPVTTGASVRVSNYLVTSASAVNVSLTTGANIIPIKVRTPIDIERTYTITAWVPEPPMVDHYLSNLTLDSGTLSPDFDSSTLNYYVTYPSNTTSMGIRAVLRTSGGYIIINNQVATSSSAVNVAINPGVNVIPVRVVAPDFSQRTYTITATVLESPVISTDLLSLTLGSGTLRPTFNANKLNYFVRYTEGTTSMGVRAVPIATGSSIIVNNVVTTSNSFVTIALNSGPNLVPIKVVAADQSTKTYTITVMVDEPLVVSNALSSLTLSSGILSPVFNANKLNYEVYYPKATTSMTIKPVPTDYGSSIIVNNVVIAKNSSVTLSLATGSNIIPIKVIKADGSEVIYTITAIVAE